MYHHNNRLPDVFSLRTAGLLVYLLASVACSSNDLTNNTEGASPSQEDPSFRRRCQRCVALKVSPDSASLAPEQSAQFAATGIRNDGSTTPVTVTWRATGGTIDSAGNFTAGSTTGTYNVIVTSSFGSLADTAQVLVTNTAPTLTAIVLTPSSVSLAPGGTQKFLATGKMSDSTTASVPVIWTATGGTVDSTGLYQAGSTGGTYRIIVRQLNGTLADTSAITIANVTPEEPTVGDYYVAPTGSDANPGTAAAPFRTIQKAANVVAPGDVVIVRDGIYTASSGSAAVSVGRGGNATAGPVTFRAEHQWGAKLDGRNNATEWGFSLNSGLGYVRIEGFEIYGTVHGVELYNGVHHVELVGNHVHHTGRTCTDTGNGQSAFFVGGGARDILIDRNRVHDIGRFAPGENGCSLSTTNYQNHDHGIYVAEADNITITNNVLYNIKRGFHIQRYSSSNYVADRLWILNNTFGFPNPYRSSQITVQTGSTNLRVENNVFYDPLTSGINFASISFPNATVKNNVTYSGVISSGSPSGATFSGNLDNTDPKLVDPAAANFHLQDGGPAIDRGLSLSVVKEDFDQLVRPRGAGYDIGAFER